MALSKKLRFDVFKRDLFQCQYCGRTPPAVVLEVDHINPRSKSKNDSIDNLITSCFDCNRGKAVVPLTEVPEAMANKMAILREKRAQLRAFDRFLAEQEGRITRQVDELQSQYRAYYPGYEMSDRFCLGTLRRFLDQLTIADLKRALVVANGHHPDDKDQVLRYFCGICWNWIKNPETRKW